MEEEDKVEVPAPPKQFRSVTPPPAPRPRPMAEEEEKRARPGSSLAPRRKRTNIYVRIRPKPSEGFHGAEGASSKRLVGWDQDKGSVTVESAGRQEVYSYPDAVVGPEVGQQTSYDMLMGGLLEKFLAGYNCTFIAYGQTGTGKTHTMFGAPASLKSLGGVGATIHPDWGIFPRAVVSVMEQLAGRKEGSYLLTASVVDLYMMGCFDLLNDRTEVAYVGSEGRLSGYKELKLHSAEDVKLVVNTAMNHRVMSGTKCNETSSRSHCIATLTLTTYDKARD